MSDAKFIKSLARKLKSHERYTVVVIPPPPSIQWIEIDETKSIDDIETQIMTEAHNKGEPFPGDELAIFLNSAERGYIINFRPLRN